jgi:hypothetical protein
MLGFLFSQSFFEANETWLPGTRVVTSRYACLCLAELRREIIAMGDGYSMHAQQLVEYKLDRKFPFIFIIFKRYFLFKIGDKKVFS